MPERTYTHPLFGPVRFRTVDPEWTFGGKIKFLSGFDVDDIMPVFIPQLQNIPTTNHGNLEFHKRGHEQLKMAFADIEKLGLLKHVKTCEGSLNVRLKKPISKNLSKEPSNHAFGIAIDLNAKDGSNGATTAPLAPVFEAHGFRWGKSFHDPMHYEVKTFVDEPKSIAQGVTVALNGIHTDLGAMNLFGNLFANLDAVTLLPNVEVGDATDTRVQLLGPGEKRKLKLLPVGDDKFVPLPQLAGVAGLAMAFDNAAKSVSLTPLT